MENVKSDIKDTLLKIIYKYLPNCRVYLFGSRAKGTNKQGADIDLALNSGHKIDWKILCDIKEEVENTTIPVFVDLIDVNSIDNEFLEQIQKEWVEWTN
ncbi:hypothetical protein GF322_05100 [Candidatus Dependentiae bacterium]|nr:hypothetical protein [Candidatus Dependentiae bacterium]